MLAYVGLLNLGAPQQLSSYFYCGPGAEIAGDEMDGDRHRPAQHPCSQWLADLARVDDGLG